MESLLILIPIALVMTGVAIAAFVWAVNNGQYDDLEKAANDILFDEDPPAATTGAVKDQPEQNNKGEHD